MEEGDKKFLLKLARKAIRHYLETGERLDVKPEEVSSAKLVENGACFVTIKIGDELKGCIGSLEATRPLFFDVIENSLGSAFGDPRFMPLTGEEFEKMKISISVLSKPEPFPVKSPEDLLEKLIPGKHGLIIEKDLHRATFLPCVWEQLPGKEQFLSNLSVKAGLMPDGWKDQEVKFYIYEAEEFSE